MVNKIKIFYIFYIHLFIFNFVSLSQQIESSEPLAPAKVLFKSNNEYFWAFLGFIIFLLLAYKLIISIFDPKLKEDVRESNLRNSPFINDYIKNTNEKIKNIESNIDKKIKELEEKQEKRMNNTDESNKEYKAEAGKQLKETVEDICEQSDKIDKIKDEIKNDIEKAKEKIAGLESIINKDRSLIEDNSKKIDEIKNDYKDAVDKIDKILQQTLELLEKI